MNYIQKIANQIRNEVPRQHVPESKEINSLFTIYAVLLLAKGVNVNEKDVHNAWSAWMSSTEPDHQSIEPFENLPTDIKQKDKPFVDAIKKVASTPQSTIQ